jgi:hypothetical protein
MSAFDPKRTSTSHQTPTRLTAATCRAIFIENCSSCGPQGFPPLGVPKFDWPQRLPLGLIFQLRDGTIVFREACRLGCEGIVLKRLGSIYRRGRSPHWVKIKNPKAPAVTREAEEDWAN